MAPAAELFIVKITHKVFDKHGDEVLGGMNPEALDAAFEKIVEVVKDRKLQGKSVVTCSVGKYRDFVFLFA